jgi:hypothetical protein
MREISMLITYPFQGKKRKIFKFFLGQSITKFKIKHTKKEKVKEPKIK